MRHRKNGSLTDQPRLRVLIPHEIFSVSAGLSRVIGFERSIVLLKLESLLHDTEEVDGENRGWSLANLDDIYEIHCSFLDRDRFEEHVHALIDSEYVKVRYIDSDGMYYTINYSLLHDLDLGDLSVTLFDPVEYRATMERLNAKRREKRRKKTPPSPEGQAEA